MSTFSSFIFLSIYTKNAVVVAVVVGVGCLCVPLCTGSFSATPVVVYQRCALRGVVLVLSFGKALAFCVFLANPGIVYLGCASGGVYRSCLSESSLRCLSNFQQRH